MPSYRSMLAAIVLVITVASSVSNQAPASVQWVNVPDDESHSFRSLRSLRVTDASPSSNVTSTSAESLDELEERGFGTDLSHIALFKASVSTFRFMTYINKVRIAFANEQKKAMLASRLMNPNKKWNSVFFEFWKTLGVSSEQLRDALKIGGARNRVDNFKRHVVASYITYKDALPAQPKPQGPSLFRPMSPTMD